MNADFFRTVHSIADVIYPRKTTINTEHDLKLKCRYWWSRYKLIMKKINIFRPNTFYLDRNDIISFKLFLLVKQYL